MATKSIQRPDAATSPLTVGGATSSTKASTPTGTAKKTDDAKKTDFNVNLSSDAKSRQASISRATEIAKATPAVREDRVKDLKERIKNGSYQVDSGKIADGMMKEAILEHRSENN